MTAIAQTKLVIVGKYDVMTVAQNTGPQTSQDATGRLERITKSLTSKSSSS